MDRTVALPGFTLVEVLVALALTGFVLMMGFRGQGIIGKGLLRYQEKVGIAYSLSQLEAVLAKEIRSASNIEYLPAPMRGLTFGAGREGLDLHMKWEQQALILQRDQWLDTLPLQGSFLLLPDSQLLIWYDSLSGMPHQFWIPPGSQALHLSQRD